ncbi:zinc finger protein basonuclin-2-like [Mytilus edulis]|uniref:zinc finger protein basonuclin-2-like n=1 Tax=Mytilus edulis TaxID=6550 RepID=UPI0039EED3D0
MKPLEAIRCTVPSCACECFTPGKDNLRNCESCKHGWVSHALDKLGYRHIYNLGMSVEVVQPNVVFDIASLLLYGATATPVRLKILLDRLFSVLQHDEVLQVLQSFGWSYEDYARGYILQDTNGKVLDKWSIASREEEHIMLQQFLRFGETKSIAQEIILQDTKEQQDLFKMQSTRAESEIKKFIERSNHSVHNYMRGLEPRHLFGNRLPFVPIGSRLMTPPSLLNFSPPLSNDVRSHVTSGVPSSSPVTSSPLGRLQTMQPFDYHREQSSPALSPGIPEKHNPESYSSDSPKNMSLTPTSSKSDTPPYTPQISESDSTPVKSSALMSLPIMQPGDLGSSRALDFSSPRDHGNSLMYEDHNAKHLRKSHNPVKRQWTPSASFGTSFIGPNGKKRVLCTACNKTFCDKGALKIHYSAVHLKEMHKCSVDGCNMMFSSRRSRNRHSANPNPKLHMPQKRVKLPEGASIIDEDSCMSPNMVASPPSMVGLPTSLSDPSIVSQFDTHELARANHALFYSALNAQMSVFPSPEKRYRLDDDMPKDLSVVDRKDSDFKSERDDSPHHRSNRRKNMVPTRLTQPSSMPDMSDDNSDDEHVKEDGKEDMNDEQYLSLHQRYQMDNDSLAEKHYLKRKLVVDTSDDNDIELGEIRRDYRSHELPNGHAQKEYPKIASLLSKSCNDEVIDYSKKVPLNHEEDSLSSDHSALSESKSSFTNLETGQKISSSDDSVGELPFSKENPETCVMCNENFQSMEDVRSHLQNLHFKSMHFCSVNGCNAFFKSKRNQERHSADCEKLRQSLQDDDNEQSEEREEINIEKTESSVDKYAKTNGNKHYDSSDGDDEDSDDEIDKKNENNNFDNETEKDEIAIHKNGINVHCHVCQSKFKDNLALKEHFEINHPKEMFHCTIKGCEKIFSTRKSRNRHSQNGNLHHHLPETKS